MVENPVTGDAPKPSTELPYRSPIDTGLKRAMEEVDREEAAMKTALERAKETGKPSAEQDAGDKAFHERAIKSMSQAAPDNWAQRHRGMICETCIWWVPKGGTSLGRCRRRAPTLDGWPAVFGTDWCGDHKLDEASQGE